MQSLAVARRAQAGRRTVGLRLGSPFDGFDKLTASKLIRSTGSG